VLDVRQLAVSIVGQIRGFKLPVGSVFPISEVPVPAKTLVKDALPVLKAILLVHPFDTPSAFLLADAFVMTDGILGGAIYPPNISQRTKENHSVADGSTAKRVIQWVRRVASKNETGHSPEVTELKRLIRFFHRECGVDYRSPSTTDHSSSPGTEATMSSPDGTVLATPPLRRRLFTKTCLSGSSGVTSLCSTAWCSLLSVKPE
jgi:hypothetical protein